MITQLRLVLIPLTYQLFILFNTLTTTGNNMAL